MKHLQLLTLLLCLTPHSFAELAPTVINGALGITDNDSQTSHTGTGQKTYISLEEYFSLELLEKTPSINQIVSWPIKLQALSKSFPIAGAEITVAGIMPDHGHGLPSSPVITVSENGKEHAINGLKFSMPGYWELNISITQNDIRDSITIGLNVH